MEIFLSLSHTHTHTNTLSLSQTHTLTQTLSHTHTHTIEYVFVVHIRYFHVCHDCETRLWRRWWCWDRCETQADEKQKVETFISVLTNLPSPHCSMCHVVLRLSAILGHWSALGDATRVHRLMFLSVFVNIKHRIMRKALMTIMILEKKH